MYNVSIMRPDCASLVGLCSVHRRTFVTGGGGRGTPAARTASAAHDGPEKDRLLRAARRGKGRGRDGDQEGVSDARAQAPSRQGRRPGDLQALCGGACHVFQTRGRAMWLLHASNAVVALGRRTLCCRTWRNVACTTPLATPSSPTPTLRRSCLRAFSRNSSKR